MKIIRWLAVGLFVTVIVLCYLVSYRLVNLQSTAMLMVFSVFFISLFFQLDGSLQLKAAMLTLGNILGVLSNLFFYYILSVGCGYFGVAFNVFFIIIYPILNIMWIVPFWSLSLSFLPKLQLKQPLDR